MRNLLASAALFVAAVVPAAAADPWPLKPVTIIVPTGAGGPTDTFFRALAVELKIKWGQPVVIENKPGANEILGSTALVRAPADGYTLLGASENATLLNPLLYAKLPYSPSTQFAPATLLTKGPMILAVSANMPVRNIAEFIAYAKQRGNNDPVTYGTTGVGGTTHLSFKVFEKQHGLKLTQVNYKSVVEVLQDVMAGNIGAGLFGAAVIEGHIKAGRLRALVSPSHVVGIPEIPTYEEANLPTVKAFYEVGLVGPAGLPGPVLDRIAKDTREILESPSFRKSNLDPFGLIPTAYSPEVFSAYLKSESAIRARMIEDAGVPKQ